MESDVSRRLDRVLHRLQDFVETFDFDFDFDSLTPDEAIELWGSFDRIGRRARSLAIQLASRLEAEGAPDG